MSGKATAADKEFKTLTKAMVRGITKRGRYREGTVKGLYLQVLSERNRSWLLRYVPEGHTRANDGRTRPRDMGLGSVSEVSLEEAREEALDARRLLRKGIDPLEERKRQRAQRALEKARSITFADAVETYHALHSAKWTNGKHATQFKSSLVTHAYPVLGKLPVADIGTAHILQVLKPIWRTNHQTASKVRGRIERVLGWAAVNEYRTGENPARWRGHLKEALFSLGTAQVKHHKALPYKDAPALLAELAQRGGMAARALRLLLLTAARTGEVLGARWSEINLDAKRWDIPAERMKNRQPHSVPLSAPAVALLKELFDAREGDIVFPGRRDRPLNNEALGNFLKRTGRTDFVVHGLRSTFRDWAEECTSFEPAVKEMALAHAVGDKTEQAYLRTKLFDKRRLLMETWAKFVTRSQADDSVTPFRAARKVANG